MQSKPKRVLELGKANGDDEDGMENCFPFIYAREKKDGKKTIFVWCESSAGWCEFKLSLSTRRLDSMCHLEPELFEVVFIGQLKDIPIGSFLRRKVEEYFSFEEHDWVMLAVSQFSKCEENGRVVPAHFITKVEPVKNDFGTIGPAKYVNKNAWYVAEENIKPSCLEHSPATKDINEAASQKLGVFL